MGLWDKIKDYVDRPELDYDEDDEITEEEDNEEEAEVKQPARPKREPAAKKPAPARDDLGFSSFERPVIQRPAYKNPAGHSSKVVDIHTTAKLQVVLTKPEKFSDAREIADNLNEKRTIVLNLESTNKDEALRLLDFLSGVAYANDGEIKKIAKSTFIITPYNVDVMGDLLYELENNGVYFV